MRGILWDDDGSRAETMTFAGGWDEAMAMVNAGFDFCDVDFNKDVFLTFAKATQEREQEYARSQSVIKNAVDSAVDAAGDALAKLPSDETLYTAGEYSTDVGNAILTGVTLGTAAADVAAVAAAKAGAEAAAKAAAKAALCFAGGTEVLTVGGPAPIEMIRAGDKVITYDEASGQTGEFRVIRTFKRTADSLVLVEIGEETIEATDEHPFWVYGHGWVPAREPKPGMNLVCSDGQAIPVVNISFVQGQIPVYNMEIENAHTYCVSRKCVLVHNACFRGRAARRAEQRLANWVARKNGLSGEREMEMFQRAIEDYKVGEQILSKAELEKIAADVVEELGR